MNRFDERRPRFWRHERDHQEARRDDEEQRFRPESGRGASGFERNWRDRDWQDSQRYGQREPYNARGSSGRSRMSGPWSEEGSRYSESQYGVGRRRSRFDAYGRDSAPEFGEGPFADTSESPGYFGTGYYGDGGASPTGGYDQRERSRYPGSLGEDTLRSSGPRYRTGPKGYTRSDERIREDISERLMLADGIDSSEVSVSVKDGKVSLEGTVPTRSMKHAIEDLADYTAGVTDVENRIRVERPGQQQSAGSTGIQSASGITPTSSGVVGRTIKQ